MTATTAMPNSGAYRRAGGPSVASLSNPDDLAAQDLLNLRDQPRACTIYHHTRLANTDKALVAIELLERHCAEIGARDRRSR